MSLMMMCKEVVELTTEASEGTLQGSKRLGYRFHLMICPFCRAHHEQMEKTVATLHALAPENATEEATGLDAALDAFRKKKL